MTTRLFHMKHLRSTFVGDEPPMKNSQCSICTDAGAKIAVDELVAKGETIRAIAGRVRKTRSAIHRHLSHVAPEKLAAAGKTGRHGSASQAGRQIGGRCSSCGLSLTETDAQSLMRRAERILWIAETIAAQAQRDDDSRLALQAVDRARSSLETMMRATGMIGGDGAVTVQIDARRQLMANLAELSVDELRRAIAAGAPPSDEDVTITSRGA